MSRKEKPHPDSPVTRQRQPAPKEQVELEEMSLEKLLDDQRDLSEKDFLIGMFSQSFEGPIPSPKILREYLEIDPNLLDWFKQRADRYLILTETFSRAEIDATLEKGQYRKRGQLIGFAIV